MRLGEEQGLIWSELRKQKGDKHHGRVQYRYITERGGGGEDRDLVNFMTEDKKSKKF